MPICIRILIIEWFETIALYAKSLFVNEFIYAYNVIIGKWCITLFSWVLILSDTFMRKLLFLYARNNEIFSSSF